MGIHQTYFSLGEAIAALGLIFAVYQLSKPIWNIVLSIKEKNYLIWLFNGLGLIFVAVGAIVSYQEIKEPIPLWGYPLFWELWGFLFFILAPITLWKLARNKKGLFTKDNAERFYQIILSNIARATPQILEACINIIGANLSKLSEVVSESKVTLRNNKKEESDYKDYARSVFNVILTEPEVVSYISTSRLDFLSHLLREIREKHLTRRHRIGLAVSCIVEELFENQKSYLYRQLKFGGFGLYKPLFRSLFYNQEFLNEFGTLQAWNYWRYSKLNKEHFKVYIEAFKHALEGYWFDVGRKSYRPFSSAFRELTEGAALSVAGELLKLPEDKFWGSSSAEILRIIARFLGDEFPNIYKKALKENKVEECDLEARIEGKYNFPASVTAAYSKAVFDFLCALSGIRNRGEEIRNIAMEAPRAIFGFHEEGFENMRDRFLELMWKKIKENVNRGFYPAVFRVYLSLMIPSFPLPEEKKKIIDFLYNKVKPLILAEKKMVNGEPMEKVLLPESLILDRKDKKFKFKRIDGSFKTIEDK